MSPPIRNGPTIECRFSYGGGGIRRLSQHQTSGAGEGPSGPTERHKPVQRPVKNPPPREQAPTGGLGLSIRAGAQDRTLRLLGTNFVSALLIAGAFGVAVYLHDQKSKSDEDEMKRKVA